MGQHETMKKHPGLSVLDFVFHLFISSTVLATDCLCCRLFRRLKEVEMLSSFFTAKANTTSDNGNLSPIAEFQIAGKLQHTLIDNGLKLLT